MARKKKGKKQQARKRRKQQRRQARLRRRDAQRSKYQPAPDISPDDDVIADMQPLLKRAAERPGADMMEQLMVAVLDSQDLADEPELADIVIDPRLCIDTYAEVGEELGIDPEVMAGLPETQREDMQMKMLEESTRRLVTDDVQQDMLAGLNALRLRLKQGGRRSETARVAAVQSFLSEGFGQELWPMMGLVQAVVQKSLMVGFSLMEASAALLENEQSEENGVSLLEHISQSKATQDVEALLSRMPGMQDYLANKVYQMRADGLNALYEGELYLELFSRDELEGASEIFAEVLGFDSETGTKQEITEESKEDVGRALIERAEAYLTEMFTPERLDQLRARLASLVSERAFEGKWLGFVYMLMEDMKAEDAVESQKGFLIKVLFGELRTLGDASAEDDE